MSSDRIKKSALLPFPKQQVWRAVSQAQAFGTWFGMAFDQPEFAAGAQMRGRIVPTAVDEEVARLQQPHAGKEFQFDVERIEPERLISFRWHPFAVDPKLDYSQEPMTLIEFELKDASAGTLLTITESGFDRLPEARRAEAYAANEGGWTKQLELVEKYLKREKAAAG